MATIAPGTPSVYQHKHKVYIDYEDQAPYGVNVHRGPAGGLYYFSNEKPPAAAKKDEDPGDDKGYKSKPADRPKMKDIDRETKYQNTKDFLDSITKLYNNGKLKGFFKDRKLTPRGVKACIDKGYELDSLYRYQKLTPDMVDYAIKNGKSLKNCVLYQQLTDKQLEQAFETLKRVGDEQAIKDIIAREVKNDAFKQLQKKYKGTSGKISERFSGLLSNFKEFDPYEDRIYVDIDGGEKAPSGVLVIPGPRGGWYYMRTDPALQKHLQKLPDEVPKDVVMPIKEPEKGVKGADSGEKEPEYEPIEPKKDTKEPIGKPEIEPEKPEIEPKKPEIEPEKPEIEPKGYEKDIKDGYYKGSKLSIAEVDDKLREMSEFEHDDDDWHYEFSIFVDDINDNKVKLTPEQLDFFIDNVSHDTFLTSSLLKTHKFSDEQIKEIIDYGYYNEIYATLFENQLLSTETIDYVMNSDVDVFSLFEYQRLNDKQIDKAIENGFSLSFLYEHQKLNSKHIQKAIEKNEDLRELFRYQKLDDNDINIAIHNGEYLHELYYNQKLSPKMVDYAIKRGKELSFLFKKQTLTKEQIDEVIDDDLYNTSLYTYQKLDKTQITKILEKRVNNPVHSTDLAHLYISHVLTPEHIDVVISNTPEHNYHNLKYLIEKQMLTEKQLDALVEKDSDKILEYLSEYSLLPKKHIDLLIDKQINLGYLYVNHELTDSQIDKAIKIGEHIYSLFNNQNIDNRIDDIINDGKHISSLVNSNISLTKEQIDIILDKSKCYDNHLYILYETQLTDDQITKVINNELNLESLYDKQNLTSEHIDLALDKEKELFYLYNQRREMSEEQINKAIDIGLELDVLYIKQNLTSENIDLALDKYIKQNLTSENIDLALDKEKELFCLYNQRREMSEEQINKAIDIGLELDVLYKKQNLSPKNIEKAISAGKEMAILFSNFRDDFTPDLINKAIDKITGEKFDEDNGLDRIYCYFRLGPEQINRAIDKGYYLEELYMFNKLTSEQVDRAMDKDKKYLNQLYCHNELTPEQIDRAIDKGKSLRNVYAKNKLTPEQITKAINVDNSYFDMLYTHHLLNEQHIDLAIDKGKLTGALFNKNKLNENQITKIIDFVYNAPSQQFDIMHSLIKTQKLSDKNVNKLLDICEYKSVDKEKIELLNVLYESTSTLIKNKQIVGRLYNLVKKKLPKELQGFEFNKFTLNEKVLKRAKDLYNKGLSEQISEKPLSTIVGKYKVNTNINTSNSFFKDKKEIVNGRREMLVSKDDYKIITDYLSKKNYKLDDNDSRYAHNIDTGRKMSVGRLLSGKSGDKDVLRKYNIIRQFEDKEASDVEMYISMDPIDIIRKSTVQNWSSCETVGASNDDGIASDIESNNAIAYLVKGGNKQHWLGRVMIRWGNDESGKPNAIVEKYYGDVSYSKLLRDNAIDVLRKNGYSGRVGHDERIKLPVVYKGYTDSGSSVSYRASPRPTQKEIDALTKRIVKLERLLRIRKQLIERALKYNKINMKENIDDDFYVLGRDVPRTVLNKEQEQRLLQMLYNTFDNEPELKLEEIEMDDGKKMNVLEFLKQQIDEYESKKSLGHSKRIQKLKEDFHTQDLKKYIQEMFDMGYSKNIIAIKSKQRFSEISMAYIENMIDRCFNEHTDKVVKEIEPVTLDDIAEHEYKEKYEQLNGIRKMNVDNVYKNLHNMPKKFRYKLERLYKKVK